MQCTKMSWETCYFHGIVSSMQCTKMSSNSRGAGVCGGQQALLVFPGLKIKQLLSSKQLPFATRVRPCSNFSVSTVSLQQTSTCGLNPGEIPPNSWFVVSYLCKWFHFSLWGPYQWKPSDMFTHAHKVEMPLPPVATKIRGVCCPHGQKSGKG